MFQVLNADNRDEMVQVAMISRCFIVGLRYYRQSDITKFRLLQAMNTEISAVLALPQPIFIDSLNIASFFIAVANAKGIENCEGWAAEIMFLISPTMWCLDGISLAEAYGTWAIAVSAVPSELLQQFEHAVAGNVVMTNTLNHVFGITFVVFDEDSYPDARFERPTVSSGFERDWRTVVQARRLEQYQKAQQYAQQQQIFEDSTGDVDTVLDECISILQEAVPEDNATDFDA